MQFDNEGVWRLLLEAGADVSIADFYGVQPIH
jgi:hypothetical protein